MRLPPLRLLCLVLLFLTAPLGMSAQAQNAPSDPDDGSACCGYTVEGYKFYDQNGDGIMNGTDYGLAGWTIEAADSSGTTVLASTTTDSTGYYQFLTPFGCGYWGTIREVLVPGWSQSFPGGSGEYLQIFTGCGNTYTMDFGNTDPACLNFARTYTTDADFNEGALSGVVTNSDQLELAPTGTTFEYAWIANANDGTVSKVDTNTGMEVARYFTGPPLSGDYWHLSPSRTAIDADGNCWVANRTMSGQGSVTQILVTGGDDRNASSTIETSFDASANGIIEPAEMLPWGQDERVVRHYLVGGVGYPDFVPRSLAIDKAGYLWVGIYFSGRVIKLDPTLPTSVYGPDMIPSAPPELVSIDLTSVNIYPYGLALSPSGMLYVCGNNSAAEIDPGLASGGTGAGPAMTQYIEHTNDYNYGIAVDADCIVWLAKTWSDSTGTGFGAVRWDPTVGVGNPALGFTMTTPGTAGPGRGITVDFDGNIWMACNDSLNSVAKFDAAGNFIGNYPSGLWGIVGVGASSDGHMIVVGNGSNNWAKLDKNTGAIISLAGPELAGGGPYTYSDFTGSLQNITSQQQGFWTVVTDGGFSGLTWVLVDWTETSPPGTSVEVEARTAYSVGGLASQPWTVIFPGGTLGSPMPGRYIETRVRLQRERDCGDPFITPILYDLTVEAICDSCYIVSCPEDIVVPCDSEMGTVVTYVEPVPVSGCDSTWVISCTPPSGSLFPIGNTTVICEAINAANDTLECAFQVTVTGDCLQEVTGACCFDNQVCDDLTEEECHHVGGVYLGDGTSCATADCGYDCVRPPQGLTAWFPFDTPGATITTNLASPSTPGTLFGPTAVTGQYVNASYQFDGVNDYINAPDNASTDLGGSDLSIDFWVKTSQVQGVNPILDKRQTSPVRGYHMYLQDGYPALTLANGTSTGSWALSAINGGPAAFVADGNWHLVAVTVDRNNVNGIRFYVDGVAVGTPFNPTPQAGSLNSSVDLVIGRCYTIIQSGSYFNGMLDELEIFRRVITASDVDAIYQAGPAGKCREACYASSRAVCCDGEATTYVTICNYDLVPHVYSYGLNSLSGPGCYGAGVSTFSPASGTVTVGAGQCVTVPIAVMCPTDAPLGVESCFQVTVYNHDTGALFGCPGSVRRPGWWCIKWDVAAKEIKSLQTVNPGVSLAANLFIKHLPVANPGPVLPNFEYEIHPLEADGVTPSPAIRLDGRPGGSPLAGSLQVPLAGVSIPFTVDYDTLTALSFQRIVLMSDENMDGTMEPVAEFAVRSEDPSVTGVTDPGDDDLGGAAPRPFLALPNPFNAAGQIRFRIDGDSEQPVSLQLFDLRGRELKRFYRKALLTPGVHEINWGGTDGYGKKLPSGVYFLRLETPDVKETVKVVVVR